MSEFTPEEKKFILELFKSITVKATEPNALNVITLINSIQAKLARQ